MYFDTHSVISQEWLAICTQTTAIRVGRHWLQRRTDRDGPSPHLKKQRSVCVCQRTASASSAASSWREAMFFLKRGCSAFPCHTRVRNLPGKLGKQVPHRLPPRADNGVLFYFRDITKRCFTILHRRGFYIRHPGHNWEMGVSSWWLKSKSVWRNEPTYYSCKFC